MKRSVTVAAAAAAIAVVGLSGCSSDKKSETTHASSSSAASSSSGSSASVNVGGAAATTKVTIDGQDQNVTGTTVCTTMAGDVNIAIGGAATGIAAVLTDANPPEVKSVGLGNVNGVTLAYTAGTGQGDAKATKDGNGYKISGTATGIDTANPMQPVNKPFEIDVTCS
ncbi:lipoprotein LpqH [Mycobacterium sp. SMC-11]|uniref:lipoprotein LpqH n=1 Tax=Mycobacterium sp. SMC-11 TaxID=3385969 RepID=UPI00390C6D88